MPFPELENTGQGCTVIAQPQPLLHRLNYARRQEFLTYLLVGALAFLLILTIAVGYQYSLPQPQWIELGNVAHFATEVPTRVSVRAMDVWVVNTGDGFTVFHAISIDRMGCHILWEPARQKFVDWCLGIQYTLAGIYALEGPPPIRNLDRFPTRVDANGNLTINITEPIWGETADWIKKECIAQQEGPAWYLEDNWRPGCDIERILGS